MAGRKKWSEAHLSDAALSRRCYTMLSSPATLCLIAHLESLEAVDAERYHSIRPRVAHHVVNSTASIRKRRRSASGSNRTPSPSKGLGFDGEDLASCDSEVPSCLSLPRSRLVEVSLIWNSPPSTSSKPFPKPQRYQIQMQPRHCRPFVDCCLVLRLRFRQTRIVLDGPFSVSYATSLVFCRGRLQLTIPIQNPEPFLDPGVVSDIVATGLSFPTLPFANAIPFRTRSVG
ncbi:hypothetical protein C8R46DRAFT_389713 [Mycena filopes]|nr:hypothetical protein C8R46DRAFT_389713 [Mycena filopes]